VFRLFGGLNLLPGRSCNSTGGEDKKLPGSNLVFNQKFRVRVHARAREGFRFAGLGFGFEFISHLEAI